jgi:hypothetical protein
MLFTPADHWFSWCVRERANWTCEICGKKYERGNKGIHCSHYFGRGHWSVRFEPLNAFCHCFYCHRKVEADPDYFHAWVEKKIGLEGLAILREKAYDVRLAKEVRRTRGKGEIAKHFEKEYFRIYQLRVEKKSDDFTFIGYL